jgi:ribosomal protein L37AE/L43A
MFFDFFKSNDRMMATGKRCPNPKCGGTNTDCENGIWYCHDCGKEF